VTFISGARIAEKRYKVAGWRSRLSEQIHSAATEIMFMMADCSILSVRGKRSGAHRRLYSWLVDTSRWSSQCRLQSRTSFNFLHRHAEFFQIWRCVAFSTLLQRRQSFSDFL